jgi:hypothetical protein
MARLYIGNTHTRTALTFLIGLPIGLYSSLKTISCLVRIGKKIYSTLRCPSGGYPLLSVAPLVYDPLVALTFAGLFMLLVKEDNKVKKKPTTKLIPYSGCVVPSNGEKVSLSN